MRFWKFSFIPLLFEKLKIVYQAGLFHVLLPSPGVYVIVKTRPGQSQNPGATSGLPCEWQEPKSWSIACCPSLTPSPPASWLDCTWLHTRDITSVYVYGGLDLVTSCLWCSPLKLASPQHPSFLMCITETDAHWQIIGCMCQGGSVAMPSWCHYWGEACILLLLLWRQA